jgi:hypothetical protein
LSPTDVPECCQSRGAAVDSHALTVKQQLLLDLRIVVEM